LEGVRIFSTYLTVSMNEREEGEVGDKIANDDRNEGEA
jgi:hypothetical protein